MRRTVPSALLRALLLFVAGCAVEPPGGSAPSSTATPSSTGRPEVSARSEPLAPAPLTTAPTTTVEPPSGPAPRCPSEMADEGPFCVDRWEAHLVERAADGALRSHPHEERPDPSRRWVAVSAPSVFPQAYVSRDEAARACEAAGKRLCTRAEWGRACRRGGHDAFPYGPREIDGACNTAKPYLLAALFPERGFHYRYEEEFNSPKLALQPGFLERTGERADCVSDLGVHDMVGNLHEWVSDTVGSALVAEIEGDGIRRQWQPSALGNGVFMGGFHGTKNQHGPGCHFVTVAHDVGYHDYSTGFRCCRTNDRAPQRR